MAEHASDYTHGHMDVHQQESSFHAFMLLAKWGSLAVAVIVLFATLCFCTGVGAVGAFLSALILLVLGVVFLREKPGAAGAH